MNSNLQESLDTIHYYMGKYREVANTAKLHDCPTVNMHTMDYLEGKMDGIFWALRNEYFWSGYGWADVILDTEMSILNETSFLRRTYCRYI